MIHLTLGFNDVDMHTASVSLLPAFKTRAEGVSDPALGHALYDPIAEYARMGIPNKFWAPATDNNDYSVRCGGSERGFVSIGLIIYFKI